MKHLVKIKFHLPVFICVVNFGLTTNNLSGNIKIIKMLKTKILTFLNDTLNLNLKKFRFISVINQPIVSKQKTFNIQNLRNCKTFTCLCINKIKVTQWINHNVHFLTDGLTAQTVEFLFYFANFSKTFFNICYIWMETQRDVFKSLLLYKTKV